MHKQINKKGAVLLHYDFTFKVTCSGIKPKDGCLMRGKRDEILKRRRVKAVSRIKQIVMKRRIKSKITWNTIIIEWRGSRLNEGERMKRK